MEFQRGQNPVIMQLHNLILEIHNTIYYEAPLFKLWSSMLIIELQNDFRARKITIIIIMGIHGWNCGALWMNYGTP